MRQFGPNKLPEAKRRGFLAIWLHQFKSPFIYLLLGAAALALGLGHLADAGFIAAVLLLNAAIGSWQEWRAESRAEALKSLVRGSIVVRRDGAWRRLDAEALVPGDIAQVESGLKLPADLRLIESLALEVDESLLTGESLPVLKAADHVAPAAAALGDRAGMLHAGTMVRAGRGLGLVVATGRHTEVGRLAVAVAKAGGEPPLIRRMAAFTRQLGLATLGLIALIVAIEMLRGAPLGDVLLLAIALAVSAIPEGLPVAMTVALSISVRRMGRRNVVVRHLPAVEGLGACTLIATDKTGTLTLNRLTIDAVWIAGRGDCAPDDPAVATFAKAAARCSEPAGGHPGEAVGDAVDLAFLGLAARFDYDAVAEAEHHRGMIAYEPALRYAADFHAEGDALVAYVKGAPETVLALCEDEDEEASARRAEAEEAASRLAAEGYRVIAVAAGPVTAPEAEALGGLRLLGFAGLLDPLRPEAAGAVADAQAAGIRVCMITGDHPLTALAIARRLNLAEEPDDVVTGTALAALDGAAFDQAVREARLFARTEPLQKLAIVESLRRQGHVVAVTGDGINDAAALKAADIGVAMGRGGTDVARDAADLILVDDNFASIVAGIEEGRAAYANLRKVILLTVSTGAAEVMLMLLATVSGLPPPLTAVQLLWLNLVTNGIQDVALAFERPEPGLLRRKPRPAGQGVFDRAMISQLALSGALIGAIGFAGYLIALDWGFSHAAAQGAVLWLLVWCENAHCFNCRSETRSAFAMPFAANPLLVGGVLATQVLQVVVSQVPGLNTMLGLAAVPMEAALAGAGGALLLLAAVEGYKAIVRGRAASV